MGGMVVLHVMHTTVYREWKTEEGEREREFGEGASSLCIQGEETEGARERERGSGRGREEEGDYLTMYMDIHWVVHAELEITAGHRIFSDQIVEITDQIPHATP